MKWYWPLFLIGCSSINDFLAGRNSGRFDFYKKDEEAPRRYKVKDLVDNDIEPSLWVFSDEEGSLFFKTKEKKVGDIVTIRLQDKMKGIILQELSRTTAAAKKETDSNIEIYLDKVPGVIVEKMENEFIIKCRKNVLYDGLKRSIQIEGLVSRNDFADNSVDSDNLIEYSVTIVR